MIILSLTNVQGGHRRCSRPNFRFVSSYEILIAIVSVKVQVEYQKNSKAYVKQYKISI